MYVLYFYLTCVYIHHKLSCMYTILLNTVKANNLIISTPYYTAHIPTKKLCHSFFFICAKLY